MTNYYHNNEEYRLLSNQKRNEKHRSKRPIIEQDSENKKDVKIVITPEIQKMSDEQEIAKQTELSNPIKTKPIRKKYTRKQNDDQKIVELVDVQKNIELIEEVQPIKIRKKRVAKPKIIEEIVSPVN